MPNTYISHSFKHIWLWFDQLCNILIYVYICITKTNIFSVLQHETAKHATYMHNRIHLLGSRLSSPILAYISLIMNPSHFYKIWKPGIVWTFSRSYSLILAHFSLMGQHMITYAFTTWCHTIVNVMSCVYLVRLSWFSPGIYDLINNNVISWIFWEVQGVFELKLIDVAAYVNDWTVL